MNNNPKFKGVFTAMITPFKNDAVDYNALEKLIDWQIESGVKGLVVCGSTGEGHLLSQKEYLEVIKFSVKVALKKAIVIVGIPTNSTHHALELIDLLDNVELDAFLVSAPYYVKPSQEGVIKHFKLIAERAEKPIIAYDVPQRSGISIADSTMLKILDFEYVIGLKDATGKVERAMLFKQEAKNSILLSGDDLTYPAFCFYGGDGVISATANLFPKQIVDLDRALKVQDFMVAKSIQSRLFAVTKSLFLESNPILIKYGLSLLKDFVSEYARSPLTEANKMSKSIVQRDIRGLA